MNSKTCKDKNIKENKNAVEVDDVKDIDNVLDGLLGDIASEKKDSSLTAEQNFSYGLSNPSSFQQGDRLQIPYCLLCCKDRPHQSLS